MNRVKIKHAKQKGFPKSPTIKTKKYYDKANEYRGTFTGVYKAFEAAGDRYTAILKKLTEEE